MEYNDKVAEKTEQITVLKANGQREVFDEEKLRASLLHSGATDEAVEKVISHILPELHNDMTTNDIYTVTLFDVRLWILDRRVSRLKIS
jgi:transcriptional regulator NrdR family protein